MYNFIKGVSLSLAIAVGFSACSSVDRNNPEAVALAFGKALATADLKTAAKYGTEKTAKVFNSIAAFGDISSKIDEAQKKAMATAQKNLKSAKCTVEGEKATCTLCCGDDGKDTPMPLSLIKEKGVWAVSMGKEGLKKEENLKDLNNGLKEMEKELNNINK